MFKFRRRELKKHWRKKPAESISYLCYLYEKQPIFNIKVKAVVERDGFDQPMDFVLNEGEYIDFMSLNGVFKTALQDGSPYLFRFLPSDKLLVLEDNYKVLCEEAEAKAEKKREKYEELHEHKLKKWREEHDAILGKPWIYWESDEE